MQEMKPTHKAPQKKRTWTKPIVQGEPAGVEVTSYASASLGKL